MTNDKYQITNEFQIPKPSPFAMGLGKCLKKPEKPNPVRDK